MELLEDCWELIFKILDEDGDYRSLKALSLVSTTFLTITNRVRSTLIISKKTLPFLYQHLARFPKLKRIKLDRIKNHNTILLQISRFDLDLDSLDISKMPYLPGFVKLGMKKMISNVKILNCSKVSGLKDSDLVSIGECFPSLQELDISYPRSCPNPISDYGVISLSLSLKRLLKIDISGNGRLTNEALLALSRNCVGLKNVVLHECDLISTDCVEFVIRNRKYRHLECLEFNKWMVAKRIPR